MGASEMTGRGFGSCSGTGNFASGAGLEFGMVCQRGFGGGFRRFSVSTETMTDNRRKILQSLKNALKNRLADIDRQLESL